MNQIAKALPKSKVVEFKGMDENGNEVVLKRVTVKKLPLGKYAELMLALKDMPADIITELQRIDTKNTEQTIQTMFGVFAKAWGQLIKIIAIGSGIDKETLETDEAIGLDGGVELFLAIYEVNNLQKVVTNVKNMINRSTK